MNLDIETHFFQWLNARAANYNTTINGLKTKLAVEEIDNRREYYLQLQRLLHSSELNFTEFKQIVRECLAVGAQNDQIKFGAFVKDQKTATSAIHNLIQDFPEDDEEAAARIDGFIEEAVRFGYKNPKNDPDRSAAAVFCSVLLTSLLPERFVDFRQRRWILFSKELNYDLPFPEKDRYGDKIIWAGKFAASIASTNSFKQAWGDHQHPLWSVAGIAWVVPRLESHVSEGAIQMNDVEKNTRLKDLLKHKKQVVLYGPPGTGKTHLAITYCSYPKTQNYAISEQSLLDQRLFALMIYQPRDGRIPDFKMNDRFTYEWKGRRNWQKYFDELQEGDIALAYVASDLRRFTTVVRCIQKEEDSLIFEVVRHFIGPGFEEMKSDPVLKSSDLMRITMSFSLKRLNESEIKRIIELSKDLTFDSLGLTLKKFHEPVRSMQFVTFHPSFGYEDFIEGIRPVPSDDGILTYRVEDGIFKTLCRNAFNVLLNKAGIEKQWEAAQDIPLLDDLEKEKLGKISPDDVPFYLIIDEINRGDISRIFGELITLLEADKRYSEQYETIATLPYSRESFAVPPNVYLIGTMNTADRSIALLDVALRRRFGFIELMPDYAVLKDHFESGDEAIREITGVAVTLLETINARIRDNYDRDHQIGHSYLMKLRGADSRDGAINLLHFVWYTEIMPLLQEYFCDSPQRFYSVVGERFLSVLPDERSFDFKQTLYDEEFLNAILELIAGKSELNIAKPEE